MIDLLFYSNQDLKKALRVRSKSLPQSCQPFNGITCSNQDLRTIVKSSEENRAAQRRKSFAAIQNPAIHRKNLSFTGFHYEPTQR